MEDNQDIRNGAARARELSGALHSRAADACARSAELQERTRALRILIVEDHADSAEVLKKLLVRVGYEVAVAGTVHDALRLCRDGQFSRLLCDIGLPDGSGLELVRAIKRDHPAIRAIALSGYAMQRDVDLAIKAGFDAHLRKPVSAEELLNTLG